MTSPVEKLLKQLRRLPSLAVAFSGGVDSSLLLALAVEALGDRVMAVTAVSPIHPQRETREAIGVAGRLGCRHLILRSTEMEASGFVANPSDRCYICKQGLLRQIKTAAAERGIAYLAHGANSDDQEDYRPGMQAAEEMGILAPLVEAAMTKSDIRALARERGLPNWDRPAMACLATRIPHDTPITPSLLARIEAAEDYLQQIGFAAPRVRCHGEIARIECHGDDIERILPVDMRARVARKLKAIGFKFVTVDLEGYRQGSMNPPGTQPGG
ncbi:MAG: ATP-dependent sacrificial sulfur transferase LarE [Desulfosarcina sp.]|nr:ATP-dependent sacrificial sulfur transferase LarE [Desulfobacterales bacterium]